MDIFISADIPLFLKRRHIYTRTAPNLFLTKTTKLTSHGTSRYPASPLTLYGRLRQLYTRRNQRAFWKTLEVRSSRSPIITSSSFCRINLLSSTNLFRAKLRQVRQVRVFSRSVCSRGLRERGGCGRTGSTIHARRRSRITKYTLNADDFLFFVCF